MKFSLPYPPSVNHYLATGRKGQRYPTKKTRVFEQLAWVSLIEQRVPKIKGPVKVAVVAHADDKRVRDADNLCKKFLDVLVANKIIESDSNRCLRFLSIEWGEQRPGGELEVTIESLGE